MTVQRQMHLEENMVSIVQACDDGVAVFTKNSHGANTP